mgnify:CR=1 FL=1
MSILKRIVLFTIGILLSSYSLMFIIIYLNLLKMDYSFIEYLMYVIKRFECMLLFIGIFLILISTYKKRIK